MSYDTDLKSNVVKKSENIDTPTEIKMSNPKIRLELTYFSIRDLLKILSISNVVFYAC